MTGRHHRLLVIAALLAALVLAATLGAACSARATDGAPGGSSASSGGTSATPSVAVTASAAGDAQAAGARGASKSDWKRVLAALASMQANVPTKPVVVLLGGSVARESTISDSSWRAQIVAKGGPETLAWNLASGNRTMAQNVAIVRKLPPGVHAIVYIGVNLGAFTSSQKTASITLPSPAPTAVSLKQPHRYSQSQILSTAKKRALVKWWLTQRYPVYKANFRTSAGVLETLIKVCRSRGYKPVLFEMPRNTAIIRSSLNTPVARYRDKCRRLAKKYGIPWVSLVSAARLPNRDFYDLWHLVEPGRKVWQNLLSAKTAALLEKYGYDGGS